jgi:hypothetical protein
MGGGEIHAAKILQADRSLVVSSRLVTGDTAVGMPAPRQFTNRHANAPQIKTRTKVDQAASPRHTDDARPPTRGIEITLCAADGTDSAARGLGAALLRAS